MTKKAGVALGNLLSKVCQVVEQCGFKSLVDRTLSLLIDLDNKSVLKELVPLHLADLDLYLL
jgi:hypothetical protein